MQISSLNSPKDIPVLDIGTNQLPKSQPSVDTHLENTHNMHMRHSNVMQNTYTNNQSEHAGEE